MRALGEQCVVLCTPPLSLSSGVQSFALGSACSQGASRWMQFPRRVVAHTCSCFFCTRRRLLLWQLHIGCRGCGTRRHRAADGLSLSCAHRPRAAEPA